MPPASRETRYNKRVPYEFYENERKKFGSLEAYWEVGMKNGKQYFVDHRSKATTWVDPRTEATRQKDINKVEDNELPYGWDEDCEEPGFGVYYSNHILHQTFADPPWDRRIREQVSLLTKFLEDQINIARKDLEKEEDLENARIQSAKKKLKN